MSGSKQMLYFCPLYNKESSQGNVTHFLQIYSKNGGTGLSDRRRAIRDVSPPLAGGEEVSWPGRKYKTTITKHMHDK